MNKYVYICVCVCVCVYMYTCMHRCVYTVFDCTAVEQQDHLLMQHYVVSISAIVGICTHTYKYIRMCIDICKCMFVCVHACIDICT